MAKTNRDKTVRKKTASEMPSQDQLRAEIAQLAHTFYCQCGHGHGHDLEDWLDAERHVLERYQGKPKTR
ncbi:MAG: DUF2934 domain-containing protein [Nitrospiraceae bacterium]|nr:DUF2934 domain-containing protein [Nitrospiraceae bacterium]